MTEETQTIEEKIASAKKQLKAIETSEKELIKQIVEQAELIGKLKAEREHNQYKIDILQSVLGVK